MTREEAIEIIKRNCTEGSQVREACAMFIPELAESEDERMINKLIAHFKWDGDTRFTKEECDDAIAWLEKQKRPDLTEEVKKWKKDFDHLRKEHYGQKSSVWESPIMTHEMIMEKQKENSKSADSIPPDCVSNAKCEDRWHKVGDSLPDNGRLVLANDCLGNTLLARYDGEGNWEVSVYDNDDYYCRNTITKWCEIPSEKQKEQKPVDNEKVEITDFEQSVYDLCPVLGIEEAKATASDLLELAKKTLLKTGKVVLASNYPEGCSFEDGFHLGYNEGFNAQKEQKPIQNDIEREYVRTLKSLVADFVRANNYIERGYYQQIYDWLDGRHIEQKPVEINIDNPNIEKFDPDVKVTTSDSSADGKELLYVSNKSYNIGYRDGVNSVKPAEWSEEDEDMLNSCISSIEEAKENRYAYKETDGNTSYDHEISWLKSLRPSWKPSEEQPCEDPEAEIQMQWDSFDHHLAEYGDEQEEVVWLNWSSFEYVCKDLYELGKNSK